VREVQADDVAFCTNVVADVAMTCRFEQNLVDDVAGVPHPCRR